MNDAPFIGREPEMERLKGLLNKKSASLIVVRGRRRIGKSRLLSEFGKEMKSLFFSGNRSITYGQIFHSLLLASMTHDS